jgi:biopolymer transport protein ExbD
MAGISIDDDEISAINVTPLVDVVLVLLVIFMITAPTLYQNELKVNLPQAQSGQGQSKSTLEILVNQAGDITLAGKKYSLEELTTQIAATHPTSAIIMADKKTEHGRVIAIIDSLKTSGVQKFSFGVEKH